MILGALLALSCVEGLVTVAQPDPHIERIERLGIDIPRPLSWSPLAITVRSQKGWAGPLSVRSRFGFSVVRDIVVPPGSFIREIVPAPDPEAVEAGGSTSLVPRPEPRADLAVAVDARLPYADELESSPRVRYVKVGHADLGVLLAGGMLEGVDLVLAKDAEGLDLGGATAALVGPSKEDARRAVEAPRLGAVEAALWSLAPSGGWVRAKRSRAVLFAAAYAFAGFALLALASRRGAGILKACAATSLLGLLGYAAFFTRGQVWVEELALETAGPPGVFTERRIWFAGAATPTETALRLPRLALPVFAESSGAERPFVIRLEGRGCRIEGLALGPGRSVCFASFGGVGVEPGRLLRDAVLRDGGRHRYIGDLAPEGALPAGSDAPPPADPRRAPFERFLEGRVLYGWLDGGVGTVRDVDAPGLAEARSTGRFYVRKLP